MNGLARTDAGATQGRDQRQPAVRFCTRCGDVQDEAPQRVCAQCGLGVMLACAPGLLTRPGAAFLIVKSDLRVSAASVGVRSLLGDPDELIGRPLGELLVGDPALPRWIARAAMGSQRVVSVALRRGTRRVSGRLAACGDPPAALLILE
jgi:ribosomal protein L37E